MPFMFAFVCLPQYRRINEIYIQPFFLRRKTFNIFVQEEETFNELYGRFYHHISLPTVLINQQKHPYNLLIKLKDIDHVQSIARACPPVLHQLLISSLIRFSLCTCQLAGPNKRYCGCGEQIIVPRQQPIKANSTLTPSIGRSCHSSCNLGPIGDWKQYKRPTPCISCEEGLILRSMLMLMS